MSLARERGVVVVVVPRLNRISSYNEAPAGNVRWVLFGFSIFACMPSFPRDRVMCVRIAMQPCRIDCPALEGGEGVSRKGGVRWEGIAALVCPLCMR